MHIHPAPAAAACVSCSDEMGDFIVGNETVDRRRERRDAKMALEQGLSTEAVQARTLGFVWSLRRFHCHAAKLLLHLQLPQQQPQQQREMIVSHMASLYARPWLVHHHLCRLLITVCVICAALCLAVLCGVPAECQPYVRQLRGAA